MILSHLFFASLIRWLDLAGVILLVGGLAFEGLVAPPRLGKDSSLQRFLPFVLLIIGVGDLVLRSRMISGLPVANLWTFLPVVLLKSHFGKVWMARTFLLGLLGAILVTKIPERIKRPTALVGGGLLLVTVSLSGHAASSGDLSLTVLADWLHLLGVSGWVGCFPFLALVLRRWSKSAKSEISYKDIIATARRFSNLAVLWVAIILATGSYQAWYQVGHIGALVQTPYGQTLLVKLLLFLPLLGLGALNRFCFLPRFSQSGIPQSKPLAGEASRRLLHMVVLEIAIGLLIIACAALLTQLPPAKSQVAPPFEGTHHPAH